MKAPRPAVISHKKLDAEKLKARKVETKTPKEKTSKKNSAPKDPDAPKRPPTAFFVFMEGFRKSFKENFPNNKSVSTVGKAGGEKWKSMSDSEKAPYAEKALKKKAEYEKAVEAYKKKQRNLSSCFFG
ncbi:high mobility group B protein 1 isoform X2 [Jatropha curcas]|uniref:high mobility group B protein 1 isoform X2 n=1 Tax=Jatropha curcas TaxID=180498 RepID=UPI0009D662AB|nr:high mobility group B protein 1 isoform X2 [Jatropha curcas]